MAYYEIGPSLIKQELLENRDDPYFKPFFDLAVDKRPEYQFYNVVKDPDCLNDLARSSKHAAIFSEYQQQMTETLKETGDPRLLGYGHVWEDYPRVPGTMRYFPKPDGAGAGTK
jgi:uncharacterized sulfatase